MSSAYAVRPVVGRACATHRNVGLPVGRRPVLRRHGTQSRKSAKDRSASSCHSAHHASARWSTAAAGAGLVCSAEQIGEGRTPAPFAATARHADTRQYGISIFIDSRSDGVTDRQPCSSATTASVRDHLRTESRQPAVIQPRTKRPPETRPCRSAHQKRDRKKKSAQPRQAPQHLRCVTRGPLQVCLRAFEALVSWFPAALRPGSR